jgi:hypothetical protein
MYCRESKVLRKDDATNVLFLLFFPLLAYSTEFAIATREIILLYDLTQIAIAGHAETLKQN